MFRERFIPRLGKITLTTPVLLLFCDVALKMKRNRIHEGRPRSWINSMDAQLRWQGCSVQVRSRVLPIRDNSILTGIRIVVGWLFGWLVGLSSGH